MLIIPGTPGWGSNCCCCWLSTARLHLLSLSLTVLKVQQWKQRDSPSITSTRTASEPNPPHFEVSFPILSLVGFPLNAEEEEKKKGIQDCYTLLYRILNALPISQLEDTQKASTELEPVFPFSQSPHPAKLISLNWTGGFPLTSPTASEVTTRASRLRSRVGKLFRRLTAAVATAKGKRLLRLRAVMTREP